MPNATATLNEILECLEDSVSYSKKDLQDIYGKADTTISKTLEACGLSTSRRTYTGTEIKTRFHLARKNIDELGWNYEQVREHFNKGSKVDPVTQGSNPQDEPSASGYAENQSDESVSVVDLAAFKLANQAAQMAAQKAAGVVIPLMNIHLAQALADPNGTFQKNLDSQIKQISAGSEGNSLSLLETGTRMLGLMPSYEAQPALLMPSISESNQSESRNDPRQLEIFAEDVESVLE